MARSPRAPRKEGGRRRKPAPPQSLPPRLDEDTLRRFVLQTFGRARHTQDSPIVPDVWMRFMRLAETTARARIAGVPAAEPPILDLLLTPWSGTTPGEIVRRLRDGMSAGDLAAARLAQSSSRVVVGVSFGALVRVIVPLTGWWQRLDERLRSFRATFDWLYDETKEDSPLSTVLVLAGASVEFFRYAALVGFIDRLSAASSSEELQALETLARRLGPASHDADLDRPPGRRSVGDPEPSIAELRALVEGYADAVGDERPPDTARAVRAEGSPRRETKGIYLVNLNRPAAQTLFDSRRTVKADAAQRLFEISTEGIAVAVIDGGIDATHPAFLRRTSPAVQARFRDNQALTPSNLEQSSRIVATYDFTLLRDITDLAGGVGLPPEHPNAPALARVQARPDFQIAIAHMGLRDANGRDLDWALMSPLIRVPHASDYVKPGSDHGTHVAGILAGDLPEPEDLNQPLVGICPDLDLYDLRVFDASGRGDEFAILCAIEFVGWLNRDRDNPVVHAVNLSLALRHDVDSFACGRTPICEACNRLVGAGTVVVAAAGNTGFEDLVAKQSLGNGFRAMSITDPGNADAVITVGSTHRRDPHAYGVSYFSSRGPTGDGRRKPDILAPGEKITSTIRDGRSQRMDGTSMAAPHVCGAAALLMARYPELIGHPLRIKTILMSTATDLGREPHFQGAGLLDVLRALQSV